MTHKELLTAEVNDLLGKIADLGNTTSAIATDDLKEGNPDYRDATEWESFLDDAFLKVMDFANSHGIETE